MYDNDETLAKLKGRTVREIWVSPGEECLALVLDNDTVFQGNTWGDCCSQSWWADAFGVRGILDGVIDRAYEIDMPEPNDNRTRQEYDQAYGLQVVTDKGVGTFVFRNSSNGYYGGWANYSITDVVNTDGWQQITGGWSA